MPLEASCPRCGLTVPVVDLGLGMPPCPSCAGPLEEIPEAEVTAEAPGWGWKEIGLPPEQAPLGPNWWKVRRGLRLVQFGLRLFFVGWGLLVMATVAVLLFRVADRDEGDMLLVALGLLVGPLGLLVTGLFAVGRLYCCAFAEKPSWGKKLAWGSAIFTLLGALSWLVPPILYPPILDSTWPLDPGSEDLATAWLVSLACVLPGELAFLFFLREVGRCLNDRTTQLQVKRVFVVLGVCLVLLGAAVVVVPWLDSQAEQQQQGGEAEEPDELSALEKVGRWLGIMFRLGSVPLVGILLGLGSMVLVGRYLLAVGAARQAIDRRLPAPPLTSNP